MRNRTKKLAKELQLKVMRTCFEAIREDLCNDKVFMKKVI